MKYLDEYRQRSAALQLASEIHRITTHQWTIMEICGGQTHSIIKYGIDQLIPEQISLVHGPGCPVCVTPIETIDTACELASRKNMILCTFGDMLRVPGSVTNLQRVKASGGDVHIVYSPLDAVRVARENPNQQVIFLAVGFETTAPANAMAIKLAHQEGIYNFTELVSQVTVPAAIEAILSSSQNCIQGFLAAGHVCSIMGYHEYESIAAEHQIPIVVTGFEPVDLLQGTLMCVTQLETGNCKVENQYSRSVTREGNCVAQEVMQEVFEIVDRNWRGIGTIPNSGLKLRDKFEEFDAEKRFEVHITCESRTHDCISGLILQGIRKPFECPRFAIQCTPETPFGATMVSSEGACAAYYRYRAAQPSRS